MGLSGFLGVFASIALLFATGCSGVDYRERSSLVHTRYATVENFGDEDWVAEHVDDLLEEVAELMHVSLRPGVPKVRIIVTSPTRIAEVYRQVVTVAAHGGQARALYLPGANLIMVASYERTVLGHEMAHYLTDHYLKSTPRRNWERIAYMVEDSLPSTARTVARRTLAPDALAAQTAPSRVFFDPAN